MSMMKTQILSSIYVLVIVFFVQILNGQTLGPESMGTAPSTTTIAAHEASNAFDLDALTYSGTGDMRNTAASTGYSGASGLGNAYLNNTTETFIIGGLNINTFCLTLSIDFGIRKNTNAEDGSNLSVDYSTTGSSGPWTAIGSPTLPTGSGTVGWHLVNVTLSSSPGSDIKAIRFIMNGGSEFRIDDVTLTGSGAGCELPIELSNFKAVRVLESTEISFSTASERSNAYFSIERSSDGNLFEEIGQVKGAGDSDERKNYTFTDQQPLTGKNYYRLKQIDFNGQFSYSKVVSVTFGKTTGISLSPQPVSDQLHVTLEQALDADANWQLFDFAGRLLQSGTQDAESSGFDLDVAAMPQGSYVLRVVSGQTVMTKQFQK